MNIGKLILLSYNRFRFHIKRSLLHIDYILSHEQFHSFEISTHQKSNCDNNFWTKNDSNYLSILLIRCFRKIGFWISAMICRNCTIFSRKWFLVFFQKNKYRKMNEIVWKRVIRKKYATNNRVTCHFLSFYGNLVLNKSVALFI